MSQKFVDSMNNIKTTTILPITLTISMNKMSLYKWCYASLKTTGHAGVEQLHVEH